MNTDLLSTFSHNLNVAVIGANGGIGRAFVDLFSKQPQVETVLAYSRSDPGVSHPKVQPVHIDITSDSSVQKAVESIDGTTFLDIVIVATGMLHNDHIKPEKSLKDLSMTQFAEVFSINTFGPAILAKYFLPKMRPNQKNVFACLSARVSSISDNFLGGWYAYRASKTALNMIIKNAAIEMARRNKHTYVVGLHPGTVNTPLSKPFQSKVKKGRLFTPSHSTERMLKVINQLSTSDSGKLFAWDGSEVLA